MDYLLLMIIVQVVLESIPISSSGHLTLGSCMCAVPAGMTMCKAVYHVLHGPTVIVLLVFFYSYWRLLISWRPFIFFVVLELITLIGYLLCAPFLSCMPLCVGFCITAFALFSLRFVGPFFDRFTRTYFDTFLSTKTLSANGFNIFRPFALSGRRSFNEGGCIEGCDNKNASAWRLSHALIIGVAQALAFIPGVSRFGSTLVAASWCQLPVRDAFAIACLAEIPLALFGCMLGCYHIIGTPVWYELTSPAMLAVVVGASVLSYIVLGGVWYLAQHNRLWRLCWYMLLPIGVSCIM